LASNSGQIGIKINQIGYKIGRKAKEDLAKKHPTYNNHTTKLRFLPDLPKSIFQTFPKNLA